MKYEKEKRRRLETSAELEMKSRKGSNPITLQ
jgi:hypothetical protein